MQCSAQWPALARVDLQDVREAVGKARSGEGK